MQNNDSRRKKPRFSINIDGYYFKNDWVKCRIFDLNLEGVGVSISHIFELNDIIKIKIINNTKEITCDALVVYASKARIGIKFLNLKDAEINFIKEIINSFSTRYKI
jgi:PilZ domain